MSAAPTITGARPIPGLTTKTVPLRRSSNARLRCGDLADGVGPIPSPIRRSGPVEPGPIHRASLAVAVSTADVRPVSEGSRFPGPEALVERGFFLPQAFDGGAAFLGLQALLARAGGRLGRPARNGRHRGALDQVHETFARVLAVARLGAMAVGVDHEHALAREPAAGEAFEPRAHVVGKARRAAHVEAQLNRARQLVDVLPARAGGASEVLLELALGDADRRGDADHR